MSGPLGLKAKVEIPPGEKPFLEKVRLDGVFGVDKANFTTEETQQGVNKLSAGARGANKEDAETVMTDLTGEVVLKDGIAKFSNLRFIVPGVKARMLGTYNIINHKIDLHGRMKVDTEISKTSGGMRALLLKIMDPFFKKKRNGEVVPVHIAGTYGHPQFGLDMIGKQRQEPASDSSHH
jgi:hypothetical protein